MDGDLWTNRINCERVDMGAYESGMWGQYSDVDGDGISDADEVYRLLTDPTNALSGLYFLEVRPSSLGCMVSWASVSGLTYFVERSTNLLANPAFVAFSNITAATESIVITDRQFTITAPGFYRVGVRY